jgi:dTDP-glucose pyrophosphorylase/predicted transcriptional regulator
VSGKNDIRHTLISAAETTLSVNAPLLRALEVIEKTAAKIVLVVDADSRMVGSVTDGDIRRGLLRGCTLDSPVSEIMHKNPYSLPISSSREHIIGVMQNMGIQQIPLLDANNKIVGIALFNRLAGIVHTVRKNRVVIMAGGKGRRLLPLTTDIPKPMVEVGGRPILEWIVQRFVTQGFVHFTIAINYLGHMIESYFGDGSRFGCNISYIREQNFLGTAGALSMLEKQEEPFILINGDILASIDFSQVMDYHLQNGGDATICARSHRVEVPYGVIKVKDGWLKNIIEKPVYEDVISAGIYVINPQAIDHLQQGIAMDMPGFLLLLAERKKKIAVFRMDEEWIDVGRHTDLERLKLGLATNA